MSAGIEASALADVAPQTWREAGRRLRDAGFTHAAQAAVESIGKRFVPQLCAPLHVWHLRRRSDPAAWALRALAFGDPVASAELEAVLGDTLAPLREAGFLAGAGDDRVVSPLRVRALEGGGFSVEDAAAAWRPLDAELARAARPDHPQGDVSLLVLEAGGAAAAIALAPSARRVVAVERDPRAAVLARAGAALSDAAHLEVREAPPDARDAFTLVAATLPSPAPSADAVVELLAAARARLSVTNGARAFVAADVPLRDESARHEILSRALGDEGAPSRVVVFERPADLEELCARAAMKRHPDLGPAVEGPRQTTSTAVEGPRQTTATVRDTLFALRDSYARQGATTAYRTIYALQACDPGCGWVRVRRLA